jgi:hypothetical protein
MSKLKMLPAGCGYQGYEFGAGAYPDSQCFGGRLYDMDNCDGPDAIYEPAEYIPCPMCQRENAITYWTQHNVSSGMPRGTARKSARSLVDDIRKNRQNWHLRFTRRPPLPGRVKTR